MRFLSYVFGLLALAASSLSAPFPQEDDPHPNPNPNPPDKPYCKGPGQTHCNW